NTDGEHVAEFSEGFGRGPDLLHTEDDQRPHQRDHEAVPQVASHRPALADDLHPAGEVFGDVFLVRLQGAATDLQEFGVAPQLLDDVLAQVAVAAEDLHGVVRHLLGHGGGDQLHPVRVDALPGPVEVHAGRRVVQVGAGGHVLRVGVGNVPLDLAEGVDRLAEGGALV